MTTVTVRRVIFFSQDFFISQEPWVTGLKSRDYEYRLKELGMSSLSQRREEINLSEMYKIMT
jgi:hypothetical protein